MKRIVVGLLLLAAIAPRLLAQTSASFRLTESVFNAGGNPAPVLSSASYSMTLDAVGDFVLCEDLASASFGSSVGFPAAYPPPGEVLTVTFSDKTTLTWTPEGSTGTYNIYRGLVSGLPGGYGICLTSGMTATQTTDAEIPDPGQSFFYLISAENRIAEEGTKGYDSSGADRPNLLPCP